MERPYPSWNVLDLWDSQSFNDATRGALTHRLKHVPERRFFTEDEWTLMDAAVARLVPQPDRAEPIPVTPWIDHQLTVNRGDGFRYHDLPHQREAWRHGLAGIEAEARARHGTGFAALDDADQDALLRHIQNGEADPTLWPGLSAKRFFTELLLRTVVTIYYAHPDAWNEIGFSGPASPRGHMRLGIGERDPWEPEAGR
jgi:hypothetical protein